VNNDPVCIFQYSVVKIALGRRIASGVQGTVSELQATFSGRLNHLLLSGDKKELGGDAKPGLCEILGLAIRGLFGRDTFECS